jgi:hypothetical protein
MRHLWFSVVLVLMLSLSACGSKHTVKKKDEPTAPAPVAPPAPTVSVSTPPPQPSKTASPASPKDAPSGDSKPPADANKPVVAAPASGNAGFSDEMVGGHPVSEYILKLDSKNKDEVIEAINACSVAKPKKSIEKITALTKSEDKDIAAEATEALRKIGAGR